MKLLAPGYYKSFACIADRCRHSCCVGWEIDIDDAAMEKYAVLSKGYGKNVIKSIEAGDPPHFRLCEDERCPHLNERGLCRIIESLGEEYLCHICREHPRFYNDTPAGREAGLGLCCEEACRIILSSDEYDRLSEIGETEGEPCAETTACREEATRIRGMIFEILSDRSVPYTERLTQIYSELSVSPSQLSDEEWRETLSSLEYLDKAHSAMFQSYTCELYTPKELEEPLERALAYFLYRHLTKAEGLGGILGAVGFSLFCERLICSVVSETGESVETVARIVSEELEYCEENTEEIQFCFLF